MHVDEIDYKKQIWDIKINCSSANANLSSCVDYTNIGESLPSGYLTRINCFGK